jgi:alkaline phosphatase D
MPPIYDRTVARLSRRDVMRIVGMAGAAAIAHPIVSRSVLAQPLYSSYPFTLGVASGDPTSDGVVLWTRLAPKPLEGGGMPMSTVPVTWEIAEDPGFQSIAQSGTSLARPELGHSVHVEVNGLRPGREYWYRFFSGNEVSRTGRTKTAPPAGAPVDRLRFAVCGCSNYEMGYFTACRHIAEEEFDFVFHTGDYIYESRADGGRRDLAVRQHLGDEIFTVVDYRNRYAQYKMDRDLLAAHASAPFIVTWDDHEVDNDYAGDRDERGTPPEVFLLRRAAAYQAYYESMPLRAGSMPIGPNMRLYRRLHFGTLIDLSVLDTRQFRDVQPCGGGNRGECAAAQDPQRTMLGGPQERWLFDNLADARATWTVLGQQVPTYVRDTVSSNPGGRFSMDKWDGYAASRHRLYARLLETKAPNPVVLSGDVHVHYGADLKIDFAEPRSATVGVELTNSSITSNGDGNDVSGGWDRVKPDNPHIKFHSGRRGYVACTATARALRADFRIVQRVAVPDEPLKTAGSLIVETGRPGAHST